MGRRREGSGESTIRIVGKRGRISRRNEDIRRGGGKRKQINPIWRRRIKSKIM